MPIRNIRPKDASHLIAVLKDTVELAMDDPCHSTGSEESQTIKLKYVLSKKSDRWVRRVIHILEKDLRKETKVLELYSKIAYGTRHTYIHVWVQVELDIPYHTVTSRISKLDPTKVAGYVEEDTADSGSDTDTDNDTEIEDEDE